MLNMRFEQLKKDRTLVMGLSQNEHTPSGDECLILSALRVVFSEYPTTISNSAHWTQALQL